MKTQNRWKFGTAVLMLALWLAPGCANKQNVAENEQVDGFSDTAATTQTTDGANPAPTDAGTGAPATEDELLADASGSGAPKDGLDPNAPKDALDPNAPVAQGAGGAAGGDPAMETLFEQSSQEAAAQDPNFDALAKSDGIHGGPGATGMESTTAPAETPPADALGAAALTDPATTSDAQAFASAPTFTAPKTSSAGALPKIPGRALSRKGANLNRYYFLRAGDTAKSVSELVYGSGAHMADLKKWNKGRWMPGKVVYYTSPTQADDAQMISFYDERNLTPEEYQVGKGETMTKVAKKKLGSSSSWKEIAIVNGLSGPNGLKKGQSVKLYTNLGAPAVAAAPEAVAPPVEAPPPVTAPPVTAQAPVVNPPPVNPPPMDPMADDLNRPKKKPRKEGLNLGKLFGQNAFTVAMGAGIGLLLLSLVMINRRKKGGVEEFNEDAFAPPGKKKRS